LASDLGDAIAHDPEVRQARMIADAARSRLLACMTGPQDEVDLAEAQGMLDALRNAQVLAEDAEDRVLMHHGLLTTAEADERAAHRRPAVVRAYRAGQAARSARRPGRRLGAVRLAACALGLAALAVVLARWAGVRLPLARW
jgi:glyoxylase-like metal-dependent hydrolase (beta-lactamase superfamily II)